MSDEPAAPPTQLCFELSRDRQQHGAYWHLHLHVFVAKVEQISDLYEETVDNKAGYRDQEVADRMGRWWQKMLAEGRSERYETDSRDFPSFYVEWQEYEPGAGLDARSRGYCQGRLRSLGNDSFRSARLGWDLLVKIAKVVEKMSGGRGDPLDDPTRVVYALEAMGGVVTERADRGDFSVPLTIVRRRERRMRLRSEGVLSMVGG